MKCVECNNEAEYECNDAGPVCRSHKDTCCRHNKNNLGQSREPIT